MPKAKTKEPDKTAETGQDAGLAARVEKLEEEVRELRELLRSRTVIGQPGPNDWQKSFAIFKDDPTFDEAVRLGRAWRRRQPKC